MNNFIFENATKVFFGRGSDRENGIYEEVMGILSETENRVIKLIRKESTGSNGLKTDEEAALAGIEALEDFIVEIGLPVTLRELGVEEQTDLKEIADSCTITQGCYKRMSHEEILEIFRECL